MLLGGGALIFLGYVGCVVPVLPGPLLAYAALWLPFLAGQTPSANLLVAGGAVVAGVTIADYLLPSLCAKRFKCSGWGVFGCFAGTIAGLFFLPLGIVLGPFVGTICGELVAGKDLAASVRGGFGALLGFVATFVLKFAAVSLCAYWVFSK